MSRQNNPALQKQFLKAAALHQAGNVSGALLLYQELLNIDPKHVDALHYAGVAYLQLNQYEAAMKLVQSSLDHAPRQPDALSNLAAALNALGQSDQAEIACNKSLSLKPKDAGTLLNRAIARNALGKLDLAENDLRQALVLSPSDPRLTFNLGNTKFQQKRYAEAIKLYESALARSPNNPEVQQNLAAALIKTDQADQAEKLLKAVVATQPANAMAWSNLGVALAILNKQQAAWDSHQKALALEPDLLPVLTNHIDSLNQFKLFDRARAAAQAVLANHPDHADLLCALGNAELGLGNHTAAETAYRKCVCVQPKYAAAWTNIGVILAQQGRQEEALQYHQKSLELDNSDAVAWNNLGSAQQALGLTLPATFSFSQALKLRPLFKLALLNRAAVFLSMDALSDSQKDLTAALNIDPDLDLAPGLKTHVSMIYCDWQNTHSEIQNIIHQISLGKLSSPIFPFLSFTDQSGAQRQAAELFIQATTPPNSALGPCVVNSHPKRIRVAYVSSDFRESPAANNMARFFELHDRKQFETVAVSYGDNTADAARLRLEKAFDHFLDVKKLSDTEIVQKIRSLNVEIAVDIQGPTRNSRQGIFAMRCAPVQINNFGWISGAPYFDYIIADPVVIRNEDQHYYNERIVTLPHSFFATDNTRSIAAETVTRNTAGLPEQGFVFCCFNNSYKISPEVFNIWMELLRSVPGSVMWLKDKSPITQNNLRKEAKARGIDAERLVFAGFVPSIAAHLARHRLADLFLDNFPFSAQTTASDALWAGLPVITRMGQALPSRVAASLLTALGMPELITRSTEQYKELALDLATNPGHMAAVRAKLSAARTTATLFDSQLYTQNMQRAYLKIVANLRAGQAPCNITISI